MSSWVLQRKIRLPDSIPCRTLLSSEQIPIISKNEIEILKQEICNLHLLLQRPEPPTFVNPIPTRGRGAIPNRGRGGIRPQRAASLSSFSSFSKFTRCSSTSAPEICVILKGWRQGVFPFERAKPYFEVSFPFFINQLI